MSVNISADTWFFLLAVTCFGTQQGSSSFGLIQCHSTTLNYTELSFIMLCEI